MDRKKLSKLSTFLMLSIFFVNSLALKFHWYSSIWWIDMVMHFLAGFWVSIFSFWFLIIKNTSLDQVHLDYFNPKLILNIILFVLFVGVSWEVFEFIMNNYIGGDVFNTLDTLSDVFFDLSGGAFAVFYLLRKAISVNENRV